MANLITLDNSELREFSRKLHLMSSTAIPNAVRYTLDKMAYQTMREARRGLKDHFTLRNTWTSRSIAYEKVGASNNIDRMESCTGSRMAYMRHQEEGINRAAGGKYGEPIPTTEASGEGQVSVRKKRVLRKFYLSRLRVAKGLYQETKAYAKSTRQHIAIMAAKARKMKRRIVYWRSPRSGKEGLVQVLERRLPMLYDLTLDRIRSEPRHWLRKPTNEVTKKLYDIYGKALRFQLYKLK